MSADVDGFSSATAMLEALRAKQVSAVELLELHLDRIERLNGPINAIVVKDYDRARQAAQAADAARARGEDGKLLGLPLTIKDSIDVEGLPSTAGVSDRAAHRAEGDAALVARVRAAGAVIVGKTNIPPMLTDWQSDNPVYGRTNNPWNLERTPGGSTGGGGAALAAGLTPLEFGSDIGGSIRNPASWCGVYGHRPSSGVVPLSGHFPGSSLPNPVQLLGVVGPLARSADDLDLALDVVAGPDVGEDVAWRLELPPPRHTRLSDFRVAVLPSIPWLPVSSEMLGAIEQMRTALCQAGARVEEAQPDGLGDLREHHDLYLSLLTAIVNQRRPEESRALAAKMREAGGMFAEAHACGVEATAQDYLVWHGRREAFRAMWRTFFREWDVLLAPIAVVPAPPHTTVPTRDRVTDVNGRSVSFTAQLAFPALSVLTGQPATAFPVGLSADGLPVGLQGIGPYLEDRTTIRFAGLMGEAVGGFRRPPGYD
ncbi:MAG TPA: amidase [Chloroflexota bacterium]|nr:amidase [Chloroflexota bacterium]